MPAIAFAVYQQRQIVVVLAGMGIRNPVFQGDGKFNQNNLPERAREDYDIWPLVRGCDLRREDKALAQIKQELPVLSTAEGILVRERST